ncbi:MAG: N-acetylmuramic acid 6-phosphate etherase [Fidelibacterota bacterium]
MINRGELKTEQRNPDSHRIDSMDVREILHLINKEDQTIASKVSEAIPDIEKVVDLTTAALRKGNKVFYIGAGTSGRLGVLDASEMPPTYSVPPGWFNGIIAGGDKALRTSVEGAEDKPENAVEDLQNHDLDKGDVVIGISTSGAAAYVQKAIDYGHKMGCSTVYLICTPKPYYEAKADVIVMVETGPEVVTGSTRMKAGTATKLVLNMISTTTMVQLGKVYGNLMVDLMTVNDKLVDRGSRIISQLTGLEHEKAKRALFAAGKSVKNAVVMVKKQCSLEESILLLKEENGSLRKVLENFKGE